MMNCDSNDGRSRFSPDYRDERKYALFRNASAVGKHQRHCLDAAGVSWLPTAMPNARFERCGLTYGCGVILEIVVYAMP